VAVPPPLAHAHHSTYSSTLGALKPSCPKMSPQVAFRA
jgi:hypothetical protein